MFCSFAPQEKEGVDAVSVGAILSDYQRVRVENVCLRLGLQPLAYLWRRDQESLLSEMISCDLHAILIKVAAFGEFVSQPAGLDPEKHLGKSLADVEPYLKQLSQKYGVHICGEGGEYETFTLDCPLFKKKIVIDAAETVIHSADAFAPVGYLRFTSMHTENKDSDVVTRALPHGSCPCQSAIDKMTEEVKYADQVEDNQHKFTSDCDLSCQWGHDVSPSCSPRSSKGYQWICGINGLQSEDPGIESQTLAAFTQLQSELDSRRWKIENIVLVHLYVRNIQDFVSLNAVYKNYFDTNPPARVCVQAPLPAGQQLQMDFLLHDWTEPLEEGCFKQRETLHVQSLSHWAPANIGPYSQALRVEEVVFCAGQIALVPCTMQLVQGGTYTQALLSFSHVKRVLEAVVSSLTLAHVFQAHCYTTRHQDMGMIRAVWDSVLRASTEGKRPKPLLLIFTTATLHPYLHSATLAYNLRSLHLIGSPVSLGSPSSPPPVICLTMGIGPQGERQKPTSNMWLGDLWWESEIKSLPLLIAVVPALPKEATVELHVTATEDEPTGRKSTHVTKKVACGSIDCHTVLSADGENGSLSLSLEVPGDDPGVIDVKHVTEDIVSAFIKAMNMKDAKLVPLCARVFYKSSHSLAQQIVQEFKLPRPTFECPVECLLCVIHSFGALGGASMDRVLFSIFP
ncbi:unnamed protein product [Menidia menidia]|uniref:Diphthine--ammonia ligase n=1 Tax=Menidia menidia TaxID=238744 RepID=A0A8S4AEZ8_9TELE|nr:unnamed protein product [Menidia menidia]